MLRGNEDLKAAMKIAGTNHVDLSTGKMSPVTTQQSKKDEKHSLDFFHLVQHCLPHLFPTASQVNSKSASSKIEE